MASVPFECPPTLPHSADTSLAVLALGRGVPFERPPTIPRMYSADTSITCTQDSNLDITLLYIVVDIEAFHTVLSSLAVYPGKGNQSSWREGKLNLSFKLVTCHLMTAILRESRDVYPLDVYCQRLTCISINLWSKG